jgi:hypothetical protein
MSLERVEAIADSSRAMATGERQLLDSASSAETPLWERVTTLSATGGVLGFALAQLLPEFAWLVPLGVAVVGYWLERRKEESHLRAALAALLIVAGSVVVEVVVSGFALLL